MGYQIYCGKGFDTQKAERFFKERRVSYQRVDVLKYGIGKRELESVAAAVGLDALCDDFEPQNDALLTVTVYTDTQDFSASFYQDQGDGKYAYVVAGAENERFLKTDAWRVGTLLLTCEGTRIFDASGQETPVD